MPQSISIENCGRVSDDTAEAPDGSPSPTLHHTARGTFRAAVALLSLACLGYAAGMRLNLTASMPAGLYRLERGRIRRGTIVVVCLPLRTSAFARSRGFVPSGACAGGTAPIGKPVAAIHGDTVDVSSTGITVNGRALAHSRALAVDSDNRSLQSVASGRYIVSEREVWLVSSFSPRSFDSRYFGPVHTKDIVGRVRPLLVFANSGQR